MVLPVRGFRILANSFATPYVTEPLLDTMGLGGCPSYVFWEAHIVWVHPSIGGMFYSRLHLNSSKDVYQFAPLFVGGVHV